ncbi:MAG: hypothetical protein FWD47_09945 [Treponema sp.]|nr:hypothetical protein [Treponema sp.]
MKTKHIETIRKQLKVALSTISLYNSSHKEEINHINDIFNKITLREEEKLAMKFMLSSDKKDQKISKFYEKIDLKDPKILLEQYKVLLLTAMIYNPYFYSMAVNYRGFIDTNLIIREVEKKKFRKNFEINEVVYDS